MAIGIVRVPAAAHTPAFQSVLEALPLVEVLVGAFVAELADIVGQLVKRVPGRTWCQHLEVDSIHFEEGHHSLGRSEPGAAFQPSHGQHSHFGCRLPELQLP